MLIKSKAIAALTILALAVLGLAGARPTDAAESPPALRVAWTVGFSCRPNPVRVGATLNCQIDQIDGNATALSFTWDFGDGTHAVGETVSHVYTMAGSYTIESGAADSRGGVGSGDVHILVLPAAAPPPAAAPAPVSRPAAPAAPAGLLATVVDPSTVRLDWSAPAGGVDGYEVYDGGSRTVIATPNAPTFTVANLAPGTYFCYIVFAYNAAGVSGWSNWACGTTPGGDAP